MSQATLLDGIVVLDATQVMAGPYCAMLLSDMGARVIKVEPPDGDSTRAMAGARGGDSAAFNAVNRGKLGMVLDLSQQAGREVFTRLARSADILIENFRPGVMARLGLDYPRLSLENPRLIYASISGFGQTGPEASKGGFDLVAQGMSGIMSVTGEPDGPPVKAGIPHHRPRRRAVRADRHPRRAALAHVVRPRSAHRHVVVRSRAGAVGVGGDRVLFRTRQSRRGSAPRIG